MLQLGIEPECAMDEQMRQEVKWRPIEVMKDDFEVSRVIREMNLLKI
ncbi:hypothetical protein [Rossellomorea aquimaris]|nr:hypothetical protein [Rossellomorea aquimaris]